MHENGSDKRHTGDKYGFLLLTLVGTSKGLEDVDIDDDKCNKIDNLRIRSKGLNG